MPLILVVDDLDAVRMLFANFLARAGYEVLTANNGTTALRLCQSRIPDLILLDIQLPDLLGYEVCRRLKADPRTASVPVILTTSVYVEVADRVEGLRAGASEIIVHPCPLKRIGDVVAEVLAGSHKLSAAIDRAVVLEYQHFFGDATALYHSILSSHPSSTIARLCEEGLRRIQGASDAQEAVG